MSDTPKRRGAPIKPPEQRATEAINVRLTAAQRARYEQLGGPKWLKELLDRTHLPNP